MTRKPEPELIHTLHTIDPLILNDPPTLEYLSSPPFPVLPSPYTSLFIQPTIELPHKALTRTQHYLYIWHTIDDLLPFYVGIGTLYSCTSRHKYPNNQISIHQMYRDICGPHFLCTIIRSNLSPMEAQAYQHYTYSFYSSLTHPGCYTQQVPSTPYTNYQIHTPYNPLTLPPESELVRWGRKHQLQQRLTKWLTNNQYQRKLKERTKQ